MRHLTRLAALCALAACSRGERASGPETELRAYYREVGRVFRKGDAQALADLYDPAIRQPMTQAQILDWGRKFFGEHQETRIHLSHIVFEELAADRARALVVYRVTTGDGRGEFGGTERDILSKASGRWLVTSWEKLKP